MDFSLVSASAILSWLMTFKNPCQLLPNLGELITDHLAELMGRLGHCSVDRHHYAFKIFFSMVRG
jgi:hypothetical protein